MGGGRKDGGLRLMLRGFVVERMWVGEEGGGLGWIARAKSGGEEGREIL